MRRKSVAYKKFIRFFAKCYVFFKVVRSKPKYLYTFVGSLVVALLLIVGCTGIVHINKYKTSAEAQYESLRDNYVVQSDDGKSTRSDSKSDKENEDDERWSKAVWSMEEDADDALWYGEIHVDIEGLKEVNSDIIGWIYFEAADISYPVLYSGNNDTYLRATYEGKYATAGSIFMEEQNNKDFSDKHTLIYGHNMRDLTMFGQLKLYKTEEDYYENHKYFQLIYLDAKSGDIVKERYRIFTCKDVAVSDTIYQVFPADYEGLANFVNQIRVGNMLANADRVAVSDDDKIITLSTCAAGEDRFVVSAVKCGKCVIIEDGVTGSN